MYELNRIDTNNKIVINTNNNTNVTNNDSEYSKPNIKYILYNKVKIQKDSNPINKANYFIDTNYISNQAISNSYQSLDKNKMNPENVEIFVLEKKGEEMSQRFVKSDEIKKFIEIVDKEDEAEKEKEKKKKKDF